MECLVIVDMQPAFSSAKKEETIRNVIKMVIRAKAKDIPIIVLEYKNYGATIERITQAIGDYPLARTEIKTRDSGSEQVMIALQKMGYDIESFLICGVNYGACVAKTILGLLQYKKKIIVSQRCCNEPHNWNKNTTTRELRKRNVLVTK